MDDIAKYCYEIGQLKRVARSGWWLAGITHPESVAEHTFRVAVLGYVIACLEGADPQRTAALCLFHDVQEARVSDWHKVMQAYASPIPAERRAFADQLTRLPVAAATPLAALATEFSERVTPEAQIARDADLLECLLQAREYQSQGYNAVEDWIVSCRAGLRTASAQQLADACLRVAPNEWWQGLKYVESRDHLE